MKNKYLTKKNKVIQKEFTNISNASFKRPRFNIALLKLKAFKCMHDNLGYIVENGTIYYNTKPINKLVNSHINKSENNRYTTHQRVKAIASIRVMENLTGRGWSSLDIYKEEAIKHYKLNRTISFSGAIFSESTIYIYFFLRYMHKLGTL